MMQYFTFRKKRNRIANELQLNRFKETEVQLYTSCINLMNEFSVELCCRPFNF